MYMRKVILNIVLLLSVLACYAQGLRVSAPSHVMTGENFRLSYVINTQDAGEIRMGNIPDALEVITGPYCSSQSSYQVVNGHASSSSSTTFTYILCATRNGTYKIPSASVVVNGHRYTSQPHVIKVSGKNTSASGAPHMHDNSNDQPHLRSAGSAIKGSDLFIKVSANKNTVYEQEPVVLTYKVYTLVDLTELKGEMPDLTGFHTLEVPLPQQKSFHLENHNGKAYRCVTWSQYIMYPQMHGALKVPSIVFKGSVVQQNRNVDPVEAFFNGGSAYVEVKRDIVAPGLTLNVLPLPTKPVGFSGGVGTFNVSAQLNKKDIRTNDPFTLRVVISGRGNMKLIKQPVVNFPKDFDKYDPKITDKTKITGNGLEGNMIYDFIAVPRNKGKYTIPAIEFTYFDTQSHTYKTAKTQPFEITVGQGNGSSSVNDFESDLKNKDINPLMEGNAEIQDMNTIFFDSATYWVVFCFIILTALIVMYALRKYISLGNDVERRKNKRANRVALKRLRQANESMLHGKKETFYEDVLKALWGYAEEKFNLSANDLNRSSVEGILLQKGVDAALTDKFIGIIDVCEMERYSPSAASENMNEIFENAMNTITSIENSLKSKPKAAARKLSMLLVLMLMTIPACAITKQNADAEYKKGNYQQAIKDYRDLLKGGSSAELYYNLGNAYYRTDNITYAILSYERALLLSPSNRDIQFNLQLAQSKTIDKIAPEPQMFLVQWYKSLVNCLSIDGWASMSLVCLVLAFVMIAVYLFSTKVMTRKIGFFSGIFLAAVVVLSITCAYRQKSQFVNRTGAIVVAPSLQLKKTPDDKAANVAVIHEGTRVDILDDSMKDWKYIRLGDNREGWLHVSQIEKI